VNNESVLDFGDRAGAGRRAVETRLAEMTEALRAHGLTLVRQNTYRDESGDGTGDLGWLWLRAEPCRFPDERHDLVVRYSEADGDWQVSTPDERTLRIPAAGDDLSIEVTAATISGVLTPADGCPPAAPVLRDVPDWVSLVLAGVITSLIVPFVQAVAGRSADDAYTALRARLTRPRRSAPDTPAPPEPAESAYVSILDPEADLQLVVPEPIPPDAVRQLAAMDRSELRGRTLVWDASRQEWFRCRRA
jgi:hypothetical protein